jgi:CDP-glucose 4,6-dehydratase
MESTKRKMENLEINKQFKSCFQNKKVIVTGNTGFKGSWLSVWLQQLGAQVFGISNGIPTKPDSLFEELKLQSKINYTEADIRDAKRMKELFAQIQPHFVFHLAAQPIVIKSYEDPVDTMSTNIMGTVNILEALRELQQPCTAVLITSDKCYDNVEWIWGYKETDALGGKDPYSASKGAAELMIKTYFHSFFAKPNSKVRVAAVRAGNVIGGGDWAANRIVPDCIRAWLKEEAVDIRSPFATRPWQHVLEPLSGYLLTAQKLSEDANLNGEPFNFGPNADQNKTVLQLIETLAGYWKGTQNKQLYTVSPSEGFKEAGLLKLNCDKALHFLKWKPVLNFEETVQLTAGWYNQIATGGAELYNYTVQQINEYSQLAKQRQLEWSNY